MLRPGVFLQNRYEILGQIGSGGMSEVYKAKCHKLNRFVAIKLLKEEFCNDGNFVARFKMEAQAAAALAHPNIVSIYDVVDEGKLHYIVMELIEGVTLKAYIATKGRLEIKESIGIAIQVAQGIAAAHEQHIIHRDIKPQNMLISKDGKVKVADFGIARAVSAQTMTSAAMGSIHYISPEQARGEFCDERSDIYSLGITMYEMVAGRVPFDGENTVAIALAHLDESMTPPSIYNPEVPPDLERIIMKCSEKKPEYRYQDMNAVIADLRYTLVQPDSGLSQMSHEDNARLRQPPPEFIESSAREAKAQIDLPPSVQPKGGNSSNVSQHTKKLSDRELGKIHEVSRGRKGKLAISDPDNGEGNGPPLNHRDSKTARRDSKPSRMRGRRAEAAHEEGEGSRIEKILAGAGVVAAVAIIAVMIAVFTRLGGIFQSGKGIFASEESTQSGGTQENTDASLDDTQIYMPDVFELSEDLAEAKLKESYLNMKCSYEYSDEIEKGRVIRQSPEAGEVVAKWSNVNVVVSNGSDKVNLAGMGLETLDVEAAKRVLSAHKLEVVVEETQSDTAQKGEIISYEPKLVAEGGIVTLLVSSGQQSEKVKVPVIVNMEEPEAIQALAAEGLMPGIAETEGSDTVEKGHIIRQSNGDEEGMAEVGSKIDYVVSSGSADQKIPLAGGDDVMESGSLANEDGEAAGQLLETAEAPVSASETAEPRTTEESEATEPEATQEPETTKEPEPEEETTRTQTKAAETEEETKAAKKQQRYVASINNVYDVGNLIGPGAGSASVTLMIRLHQVTDGKDVYKELTAPKEITGDVLVPISYTSIESMNGTDEGEVQVVDVESGAVLKSYTLTFFPMD